jgi:hypothetical protein
VKFQAIMMCQTTSTQLTTFSSQIYVLPSVGMGPAELTFTKKDGSERVMNASLEESKIPEYENKNLSC